MNKKILLGFLIAAVIATAMLLLMNKPEDRRQETAETDEAGDSSSGLIVSGNSIYVADQTPAQSVNIAMLRLETPGFVVIHEDRDVPGAILGASALVPAGDTRDIRVTGLPRDTRDGEFLYAMLHADDGDGVFNAANDPPVIDPVGNEPVMMNFTIAENASEPGAVNP